MNIIQFTRKFIAHTLYYSGILHALARDRFKGRALVLMYHRVITAEERSYCFSQSGIVIEASTFEKQMRFLRDHFKILSLSEFIECMKNGRTYSSSSCLVTFDDGWSDNYRNAYHILKQYRIPAVIFLATDYVGSNKTFWPEKVTELLCRCRSKFKGESDHIVNMEKEPADEHIRHIIRCEHRDLKKYLQSYILLLKDKSREEVEGKIEYLSQLVIDSALGKTEEKVFMSWDEVLEMAANGISFASHGKSHAILTRLPRPEVEREAMESRIAIEGALGVPVKAFSYPNGNYSEDVIRVVQNCGYRVAFTTQKGTHAAGDDSYCIRRVNIHEDMTANIPMFMARIVGLW